MNQRQSKSFVYFEGKMPRDLQPVPPVAFEIVQPGAHMASRFVYVVWFQPIPGNSLQSQIESRQRGEKQSGNIKQPRKRMRQPVSNRLLGCAGQTKGKCVKHEGSEHQDYSQDAEGKRSGFGKRS